MEKVLSLAIANNHTFSPGDLDTLIDLLKRVGYEVEYQSESNQIHVTINES